MTRELVEGRECGGCSICCKVFMIKELQKFDYKWCTHARPGSGCAIYTHRPTVCQDFLCVWRLDPDLEHDHRPDFLGVMFYSRSVRLGHREVIVYFIMEFEFGASRKRFVQEQDRDYRAQGYITIIQTGVTDKGYINEIQWSPQFFSRDDIRRLKQRI